MVDTYIEIEVMSISQEQVLRRLLSLNFDLNHAQLLALNASAEDVEGVCVELRKLEDVYMALNHRLPEDQAIEDEQDYINQEEKVNSATRRLIQQTIT